MKTKVLMVCLGNICRSPLAEGILQNKTNHQNIFIDSAGTGGYHIGNSPDPRSVAVALTHGIDISKQRCRQFNSNDFDNFDIIYAMDKSNYKNIIKLTSKEEDKAKVKLILDEVNLDFKEVPDPYHDIDEGFEKVFIMLDKACTAVAKQLELKSK